MSRHLMTSLFWLLPWLLGVAVLLAACEGSDAGPGNERSVVGVLIDVQPSSISDVDSFTLRTNDGDTLEFRIAPDAAPDPGEGFVAGHLRSHLALAEQVEVLYREEGGALLALRLVHR